MKTYVPRMLMIASALAMPCAVSAVDMNQILEAAKAAREALKSPKAPVASPSSAPAASSPQATVVLPPQPPPAARPQERPMPVEAAKQLVYPGEGMMTGFSNQPVNLNHNEIPFVDAGAAYTKMRGLFGTIEDYDAFYHIYNSSAALNPTAIAKKPLFDAAIADIDKLSNEGQAEVLGRTIRDFKEIFDGSSGQDALGIVRALFNVFPQAKNVRVVYTKRPFNTGYASYDLDVDVRNITPVRSTIRQYLKENTVLHTEISGGAPNAFNRRFMTGAGAAPNEVDRMFANNGRSR
jgi:hypothetical protein